MEIIVKKLSSLFIITAGILWGAIGIFVRELNASGLNSLDIIFIRAIFTTAIIFAILLIADRKALRIKLKDIWMFIGTGIFSIVFFNGCYFSAMNYTSLSISAILLYTAPAFVMVMSVFLFKENFTKTKLIALVLSFVGCVFVSGIFSGESLALSPKGFLFGIGAGIGYALYSIFGTYALRKYKPLTVAAYTFLFATLGSLPLANVKLVYVELSSSLHLFIYALFLAVISTVLPYIVYNQGLKYTPAGTASIMASVEPVSATLWGLIVFHEKMDLWNVLGMVCVLGSIVLLNVKINFKR